MTSTPTYPAPFYAALHTGTDGDLTYYQRVCEGAQSVLELGCGDGRVLKALGHVPQRHGLDLHEGLLQAASSRLGPSVRLHRLDMRSFSLGRRFDRILLPFSGIYCLLDDDDLQACLRRVHDHLAPSGEFVLDAYRADGFHVDAEPEDVGHDDWNELTLVEVGARTYSVFERSRWAPDSQRIDVTYRHVPLDGSGSLVDGTIEQRYLLRHQIEAHLRDAGFGQVELFGGFDGHPLGETDDHWVARART